MDSFNGRMDESTNVSYSSMQKNELGDSPMDSCG